MEQPQLERCNSIPRAVEGVSITSFDSGFSKIIYPGFVAAELEGGRLPQTCLSGHVVANQAKSSKQEAVAYLKANGFHSILNVQEPHEPEFCDLEEEAMEEGIQYVSVPVPKLTDDELHEDLLTLNLARVLALVVVGLPRPLMIMCRTGKRAGAAWLFGHATALGLGSAKVQELTEQAQLSYTQDPPLLHWVQRFMGAADIALSRGLRSVLGNSAVPELDKTWAYGKEKL